MSQGKVDRGVSWCNHLKIDRREPAAHMQPALTMNTDTMMITINLLPQTPMTEGNRLDNPMLRCKASMYRMTLKRRRLF